MPTLDISPDFTVEDIRKVREYHYELTKDMSTQERIEFYRQGSQEFATYREQRRQERQQAQAVS